ncbi:hypothetical protein C1752_04457 [Acaryochloris thomasi RCC1774]|uniref:Uncharacterized protein n=1 Tax=Acaryochloris thomasi RCC1774 TaxID=1764569 RepID=A0A2W1JT33_9CYAN|nr:hypothetical protein C1752_04457 [Acaryochloris thomasi RCC1774]
MYMAELELLPRRPNKPILRINNLVITRTHNCNRTSAIRTAVSSFKINGSKDTRTNTDSSDIQYSLNFYHNFY